MKQIHFVKLLFVALLACGNILAWGADVTLTTADYTWSASNQEVSQTVDGVTFHFSGGSTAPTYYTSDGLRTYEGCKITISSTNTITNIVFTYTINNSGCLNNPTTGTWNSTSKTWTGSATSVGFTVGHSSGTKNGQIRITKIVVTYESPGSTETTHYNVQWMVGGQKYTEGNPTTSVTGGSKVTTLPDAPADNSLSCAEKFMGWSTQNIGATPKNVAPADLFTTADASPAIIENTTFYAVFAKPKQSE